MAYLGLTSPFGIAHRGGANENLENTISAFNHSVNLGYSVLETDLQLTADGELVISHDDRLLRNFGLRGAISGLKYSELATLAQRNGDPILRFVDFLDWLPNYVRVNLDPKTDRVVEPIIRFLAQREDLWNRVCIGSFETKRLRKIRHELPQVSTSLGATEVRDLVFAHKTGRAPNLPSNVIAVQAPEKAYGLKFVNRSFIDFVHDLGLDIHIWTVDSAPDMHRLYDNGIDAVMTDQPSVLKAVLVERGHWRENNGDF